ncbi:Sodium/hydrogen exchanger family protein [Tolypocladium paradoxum]|uniref:Sodium/hydrogen exchanger family protein n=1 Tax=Tolypocladium paradoxum TaxID=94208 RepID=A0A2S4L8B5_9HYPO|nr:Sodium/hydrogen exchanger family protein [Tolypocladium paradoxum]
MLATVSKVTLLAALVIGSCVTCTDLIMSRAIAKGSFADKFVARPLREVISLEAGANDGFGSPFLMLASYLIRHADIPGDGDYLAETGCRHDEVNSCIDVLLNFGGFMYIGIIMPCSEFNGPDGTGLTYGRLILLGVLALRFCRIPAILLWYKLMPAVVKDWKEALFMGYSGPIGASAVFYLAQSRHLFPELGEGEEEEANLA